jgi:putative membrane-bound dehydrogenase-like protein
MQRIPAVVLVLLSFAQPLAAAEKDPPKPMPAEEVARKMQLPPGFKATVFAAEPDVVQPMAMTFDDRGRLWVVECLSYPDWISPDGKIVRDNKFIVPKDKSRLKGRDRITIFEDVDGDGKHDKRTVFYDKGVNFTGIEYGFGGVFVTAPPYLLFIPDKNRDDKPDGPPQILLDGWDLKAKHNAVNGLTWGPDGWLYGCNGILSNSSVGKPGTPEKDRAKMNCGVWRYHPTRRVFEVVAHGTTNPWGLDFNADGEMFITNCVIKHVFHVIPGAHYVRMFGQDITPNVYGLMPSCADHIHWGGGKWTSSRGGTGIHDKPGGGHAHAGCMIYLGDNWPAKYRGKLFTCNIHGRRVNMDVLSRHGSGYVASHGDDFLKVPDPWFRGLELKYGPDGGVYLTDWSDTGECHDYNEIHRENGRIYKITYGDVKLWRGDLAKASSDRLEEIAVHNNYWIRRRARRVLRERHPKKAFSFGQNKSREDFELAHTLRTVFEGDGYSNEKVRSVVNHVLRTTKSPVVRLALASGLQRLPVKDRWGIAEALVAHGEDAKDANIPLMIWYGIEPAVSADRARALALLKKTKIPLLRQYIVRRLAETAK